MNISLDRVVSWHFKMKFVFNKPVEMLVIVQPKVKENILASVTFNVHFFVYGPNLFWDFGLLLLNH